MGSKPNSPMFNPELDPANPKVGRSKFFGAMLVLFILTGLTTIAAYFVVPELVPAWVPEKVMKRLWTAPLVTGVLALPAMNFGLVSLLSPPLKMGDD